ncbi:hypothetical protein [Prescottella equi]
MTSSSELGLLSAAAISRAVRAIELSPVDTTEAAIAQIEQRNPSLNAVTFKGFEDARQRARHLESRIVQAKTLASLPACRAP